MLSYRSVIDLPRLTHDSHTLYSICLISILRAVIIAAILKSADFTWDSTAIANWTVVETNLAIVVACLIVLKPLVVRLFPAFSSGHDDSDGTALPYYAPRGAGGGGGGEPRRGPAPDPHGLVTIDSVVDNTDVVAAAATRNPPAPASDKLGSTSSSAVSDSGTLSASRHSTDDRAVVGGAAGALHPPLPWKGEQ